jgi:hypothetical protein
VIGCEYVPLGVSVGVSIRDGFSDGLALGSSGLGGGPISLLDGSAAPLSRDSVLRAIREALRRYLWPLPPGGPDGSGWPLRRNVTDRELEVVVARVAGVSGVAGVNLFQQRGAAWQQIAAGTPSPTLTLQPWQLPELLAVVVVVGDAPPTDLRAAGNPFAAANEVAVPVVPDLC